ncbi:unnamed protein product [Closterium sp. Naga37s-1]|nr:unnamed protein product [Closterium sp. Naga37s-1]
MTPLAALLGSPQTSGIALSGPDASPPPMLLPSPPVSPVGNSCAGEGEASAFLPPDSATSAGAGRRLPRRAGSWRVSESAGRAEGAGGSGMDSPQEVAEGEVGEAGGAGEGGCFYESVRVPRDVVRVWQDCWRGAWQADVEIRSAVDGGLVLAQGAVLAAHSQGLERMLAGTMLQQARPPWVIVLRGVPVEAIRGVVQALYCGTMDDGLMDRHIFHLLLLAHSLPIPLLKSLCLEALRSRLLSPANAVDSLVLARLVGSRALQALTQQYIVRHHADVALTDAWAMLSQEYPDVKGMLVQMVEARKKRDTGLHGEEGWALQQVQQACRPVEGLIRHFAKCGVKVSGGCGSCKVVWQLLEQHSSACEKHKGCRVPLCRQFKSKQQQEQGSGGPSAGKEKLSAAEHAEQVTALAKALLALENAKSF